MALTFGRLVQVAEPNRALRPAGTRAKGRVVPVELVEAAVRAKQMLSRAESQVAEEMARFEATLATTRSRMLAEARQEAEASLAAKAIELGVMRQRSLEQSRDDIVQLAKLLAERVLRAELMIAPEQFVLLAQRCIEEARGSSTIIVHAHPDDATELEPQVQKLAALWSLELRVEPDPTLLRGDLRIESDVGTLDARLGTQLSNLAETIRESLRV